jgi:hypothetical protein
VKEKPSRRDTRRRTSSSISSGDPTSWRFSNGGLQL